MVSSDPTVPTEAYTDEIQKLRKGNRVAVYRWNTPNSEFMSPYPAQYWYWDGKVECRHRDGSLTVTFGHPYCCHRTERFVQLQQHSTFQAGSGEKLFRLDPLTERIEKILLVQEIYSMVKSLEMSGWFFLSLEEVEAVWKLARMAQSRQYTDDPHFRYE